MSKGIIVSCDHLYNVTTEVKLFNNQKWEIRENGQAFRFTQLFLHGKKGTKVYFNESLTKDIYHQIKTVYDKKGRVVASRLNKNCRLLTTRFNKLWTFETKEKQAIDKALKFYLMIEAIEEKEYAESINTYWKIKEKELH